MKTLAIILFFTTRLAIAQVQELERLDSSASRALDFSTAKAIVLAQEEFRKANEIGNLDYKFRSLIKLGTAHLINDDYDVALEFCLDANEIALQTKNTYFLAEINTTLGWLYYDTGDASQAQSYHTKAYFHWQESGDSLNICTSLNAIGLAYELQSKFDDALQYFEKSLFIGQKIQNQERMLACLNNIGDALHGLNRNREALSKLNAALPFAQKHPDVLREAELQNSIGSVLMALERNNEAASALLKARSLATQSKSKARDEIEMQNASLRVALFRKLKMYDSVFLSMDRYNALHDQILSDTKKMSLISRKAEWEARKAEQQIVKLEEERELRINQRNAIALGIIFLTAVGFFAYSRERQIRIKENQLADAQAALDKLELDRANLEKDALQAKIDFKNKELTNYALLIAQRSEMQVTFLTELETLKAKASPELLAQLNKIMIQFKDMGDINRATEEFHANVELVNKEFFSNLQFRFPDLTENERRLCAQVRLNLSIKDIASLNGISVKAIEMARYRLRKKLNINHEESLQNFLNNI